MLSLEIEVMKEYFAKRMQLMKDEIEQRDKALSFMKYKELDYIEKFDIAEQSLKALTKESIKDDETLRAFILLQFRNPTWYLRLVSSNKIFLIPWRRLKSIFKGTKEAPFIREC
ncbi:hypothetical protein Q3G72_020706 [Acer saccharum]|nr:hypothetical protein Q3G72_020706 [Acer saccharum]